MLQRGTPGRWQTLSLSAPKRWLESKRTLEAKHGISVSISVHFAENDGGYHSAYKYVCKSDTEVALSPGHPDLSEVGSPATKKAMRGYSRKRSETPTPSVAADDQQPPTAKSCRRLSNLEVSDFVVDNKIKTRTELLAKAKVQQNEGKLDLANFVTKFNSKSLIEGLIQNAWDMENAREVLAHANRDRITVLYDQVESTCAPGLRRRVVVQVSC